MIAAIIERTLRMRVAIILALVAGIGASLFAIRNAPLDAIPDISDPQIIVYAKWSQSPERIERDVTDPIVKSLVGSSDIRSVRATTHMGYSFIYVILRDASRRDAVQRLISDRLGAVRGQLPPDATVTVGPDASSLGWILQYAIVDRDGGLDPRDLRRLNENQIRPALQSVPGVAEVASVGGLEKQYQAKIFPPLLAASGISLAQAADGLKASFGETGGRTLEVTNRDYQVRGLIAGDGIDALETIVLGQSSSGEPVLLKDVGYISVGYDQRRGIADLNGDGEVVGGIVVMQQKHNVLSVTGELKERIAALQEGLPASVDVIITYDRSNLIWETLQHFFVTLLYELAVVILVTILFLQNVRAAIAPVSVLLLGVLFTSVPMWALGQTINLFSLAGLFIAIGEMIDATIVIVENSSAELAAKPNATREERRAIILRSMTNVARPLVFSLLIILTSFLPVFFLSEKEGRLFDPLAYSKTFAMAFSTLLTILLLPLIIMWVHKTGKSKPAGWVEDAMSRGYRRLVIAAVKVRYTFLVGSLLVLAGATVLLVGFKKDFMPEMDEGSVLYMPTTLPGVPMREAGWILQQIDKKLAEFPEVESVFGKLGRADTATDSAPVSMIETTITLKPRGAWRRDMTKEKLVAEMDKAMKLVGFVNMWVQPISGRIAMQDTGIQTPVGIKVRGPDLGQIEGIGRDIETALKSFPGSQSVIAERVSAGYFVDVSFDREKLAAAGMPASEALAIARYAIGGDNVLTIRDQDGLSIPMSLQYSPEYLDSIEKLRTAPVVKPGGETISLSDIADVSVKKFPDMTRNDNGELAGYVFIYLGSGVTGADYVAKARSYLAGQLQLPSGYSVEWTGDYIYAEQAQARFQIIIPITLLIIFCLLLAAFRSVPDSLLIMMSVPFAMVGGVFMQWAYGYTMTTAVVIGYIALFAVAIQTGIIMLIFIRQAVARRTSDQTIMDAVTEGSVMRLRPKLMTVAATALSLAPVMLSTGPGMEIMQPIAAPTVGGMVSSTIYVLLLIPCLFAIGEDIRRMRARKRPAA